MTDTSVIPKGRGRMDGKVVVAVGGGAVAPGWGNGKAAAVLYAVEGAKVLVVDYDLAAAEDTVRIIREIGGEASACAADATSEADVKSMMEAGLKLNGRIDVLHNNVGGQGTGRGLHNITLDDWNRIIAMNLTSAMLTCREVVPHMADNGGGAIVNVSSIASIRHLNVPTAVYSAGKGGLNAFTQNIALQNAHTGVRANCVLPGYIDTPFINRVIGGRPNYEYKGYKTSDEYRHARDEIVPMKRMGTGWDVAYASLFLASEEASYITGTSLVVDGGVTATCPGV